jgi:hypothetical protein
MEAGGMSDPFDTGADVKFLTDEMFDWRHEDIGDEDVDDEELSSTPDDVKTILGFDPLEESDPEKLSRVLRSGMEVTRQNKMWFFRRGSSGWVSAGPELSRQIEAEIGGKKT